LAQLHQFRGRVGRGQHQSYCFLFSDALSNDSIVRLKYLETCSDGFALAQSDLESRGAGSFFGREQSGFIEFKLADLSDAGLIKAARDAAGEFLEKYDLSDYPQLQERLKLGDFVEHGE
jgi:ATP-dependent DNA helicase RecG